MTTIEINTTRTWYELDAPPTKWLEELDEIPDYSPDWIRRDSTSARGPIRWPLIAEFVAHGLDLLRGGLIDLSDSFTTFEYDLSQLSANESWFARDWFRTGPIGDPWNSLGNGRHRLTWMWRYDPTMPLPIRSSALSGYSPADGYWPNDIEAVRAGLAECEPLLPDTKLNHRYTAELRREYGLPLLQ